MIGGEHLLFAEAMEGLGAALEAQQQLVGSLRCARKVHAITEKTAGADAPETHAAARRVKHVLQLQAAQKEDSRRNADARRRQYG